MHIWDLEDKLPDISDDRYKRILAYIIEAVDDLPVRDLGDTNEYFQQIREILETDITLENIEDVIKDKRRLSKSHDLWVFGSLCCLYEAFLLMESSNISLEEVISYIDSLEQQ